MIGLGIHGVSASTYTYYWTLHTNTHYDLLHCGLDKWSYGDVIDIARAMHDKGYCSDPVINWGSDGEPLIPCKAFSNHLRVINWLSDGEPDNVNWGSDGEPDNVYIDMYNKTTDGSLLYTIGEDWGITREYWFLTDSDKQLLHIAGWGIPKDYWITIVD